MTSCGIGREMSDGCYPAHHCCFHIAVSEAAGRHLIRGADPGQVNEASLEDGVQSGVCDWLAGGCAEFRMIENHAHMS